MIRVFIGFDQRESVAYHTLCHSILSRASVPVSITPIKRSLLKKIHNRPLDAKQSNEFSFTRFLTPYMSGYEGWSIFMDCDMLVLDDIANLWNLRDERYAVMCVKHEYTPHDQVKYLGTIQYRYPRKNWSSVMLMNNEKCKALTPEYVNTASGLDLHRFTWINDDEIGDLPIEWNHLVSEYDYNKNAKLIHYTVGGPYFDEYLHCDYSKEWFKERQLMNHCEQRDKAVAI